MHVSCVPVHPPGRCGELSVCCARCTCVLPLVATGVHPALTLKSIAPGTAVLLAIVRARMPAAPAPIASNSERLHNSHVACPRGIAQSEFGAAPAPCANHQPDVCGRAPTSARGLAPRGDSCGKPCTVLGRVTAPKS